MVSIRYGTLRIGRITASSGVFAGNNELSHFRSAVKKNQAFGTVEGEETGIEDILAVLDDRDHIDTDLTMKHSRP